MARKLYIQGDILLLENKSRKDNELRAGESVKDGILAEGEATGHHHQVELGPDVSVMMLGNSMYLKNTSDKVEAKVYHPEHNPKNLKSPMKIGKGVYGRGTQRERSPFGDRRVID